MCFYVSLYILYSFKLLIDEHIYLYVYVLTASEHLSQCYLKVNVISAAAAELSLQFLTFCLVSCAEIARQAAQMKLMRKLEKQALARAAKEARKQQGKLFFFFFISIFFFFPVVNKSRRMWRCGVKTTRPLFGCLNLLPSVKSFNLLCSALIFIAAVLLVSFNIILLLTHFLNSYTASKSHRSHHTHRLHQCI